MGSIENWKIEKKEDQTSIVYKDVIEEFKEKVEKGIDMNDAFVRRILEPYRKDF